MNRRTPGIFIWIAFFMVVGTFFLLSEICVFRAMQGRAKDFAEYLPGQHMKVAAKRQQIANPKLLAEFDQKYLEVKAREDTVKSLFSLNILTCGVLGILLITGLFSLLIGKDIFLLKKKAPQAAQLASVFIAVSAIVLVNWIVWVTGFVADYIMFSDKVFRAESGFAEITVASLWAGRGNPSSQFLPFANSVMFAGSVVFIAIVFFYFSRKKVQEKFI